ncbi:MAG TPA: helix-turn-helix transcriptional regulator [Planctomycetaceae bacterium]|nr:helix-turn-helix transcriptional regulator [Planctomycetaceae bacterium]
MTDVRPLQQWLTECGLDASELTARSGLESRVVEAIAAGRYTPSPDQRRRIANALNLAPENIAWGHAAPVESLYGHGPQFGRSP